ncbi:hypothetical protein E2320_016578 [Naja naja]|nr:hypothetical protein E2320_016578 [Naja naja]
MQLSVSLEIERVSEPGFQALLLLRLANRGESTGLPRDQPRIAELCLFAVHQSSLQPSPQTKGPQLPRIIDKLILCIDPQKPFTLGAQDITGLSNQKLEENCKREINRSLMETLKGFLDRQAHPICLVAHNGLRFDFPLLRKELWQIGTDLPANTGCLDTLQALKDVLREPYLSYKLGNLYQHFYREEPSRAHTAEGDVLTLLLVFLAKALELKAWAAHQAQKWKKKSHNIDRGKEPDKPKRTITAQSDTQTLSNI